MVARWLGRIALWFAPRDLSGPYPTAFASLEAVSDEGLVAFDRVTRRTVEWTRVKRITAAMGRQHYDMTICLTIDHRGGKTIFLPETHPDFAVFLAMAERRLSDMAPAVAWRARLASDPDAAVRIYPA